MATNSTERILQGAKDTLAKANKFTNSVVGNSTNAFAPKKPEAPKIPQTHKDASYSMAHEARKEPTVVDELNEKMRNVKQYTDATKNQ